MFHLGCSPVHVCAREPVNWELGDKMGKKIYKYIGPDILEIAFSKEDYVGLKCSYPKDYNDPYELFLCIDHEEAPELLAFYQDTIGKIPQRPTTCFSNFPTVTPMWAHYAQTLTGFVIELDEELLKEHLPDSSIADVDYQDEVNEEISTRLHHAYGTCKPRHTFFLQKAVFGSAYFTKKTCWSYESERRLIVSDKEVSNQDGIMVLYVPTSCVTAIISGPRTKDEHKDKSKQLCDKLSCNYYEMIIGRSYPEPFFVDTRRKVHLFNESQIEAYESTCKVCTEPVNNPLDKKELKCPWCTIDNSHIQNAAERNPYRVIAGAGLLAEYLQSCEEIYRRHS